MTLAYIASLADKFGDPAEQRSQFYTPYKSWRLLRGRHKFIRHLVRHPCNLLATVA